MKQADREALKSWERYRKQVERATYIDPDENPLIQKRRIARLEANFEAWAKYYFPNYYRCEPASFHIAASRRWLSNNRWYEVRAWSRELAKTARAMMEDMYLLLTGKARVKLIVSNSLDNAIRLLTPYRINLESNQRIIHDYGEQKNIGDWSDAKITTKSGFCIAAIGAGQSPRGFRLEEIRPDIIDVDDIDTDEECRNPEMIKKKWAWIEQALIPTVSISGNKRIRFNGNIIAPYCCITEAIKKADHVDIVNIRDKNGKSTWPQKNKESDIDYMLSKISYISAQKEYFNNPIIEGSIFKEIYYKKLPSLSQYRFLVCYIDLSYKSGLKNDYKAAVLMGRWKDEYHVVKCWLKQGTTRELAQGLVDMKRFVGDKTALYFYAEENFLQDIIVKQLHDDIKNMKETIIINADKRKKADKFHRIESTLEPLNSNGKLFFNIDEKNNPHMQSLEEQFKAFAPGSKAHDDGPDACEGAKHIIDQKWFTGITDIKFGHIQLNKHKF
ncbi:MAG: hypothetical protein IRZ01_11220 [Thermoflavifilum aggregans]|nr:hypothetical protein [Thermoflavifilum aggregans]